MGAGTSTIHIFPLTGHLRWLVGLKLIKLEQQKTQLIFTILTKKIKPISAANKHYSPAGHHERKNKKTTGHIKFSAVTIK